MNNNNSRFGELGLIIANSHPTLGREVAEILGATPLEVKSGLFPNLEPNISRPSCDVSGKDICIFCSLHSRFDTIEELRLICESVSGSAARVFGVFSFVKSGKSDQRKCFGEPSAYKNTAKLISSSGLNVVAIFDQHSAQHPFFYDTTHYSLKMVHHVYLMRILIEYAMSHKDSFDSVLALDNGGFKRNTKIADMLGMPISFILKERSGTTREIDIDKSRIVGDVKGQRVIAFDDMLQEGGTLAMGAQIARDKGASSISFFVVHNDFSPNTHARINPLLEDGTIDKIYTLGTLPMIPGQVWHENFITISPAVLIADVIDRIHNEKHMRELFLDL